MKNHVNRPGTMTTQPGTMKNHENWLGSRSRSWFETVWQSAHFSWQTDKTFLLYIDYHCHHLHHYHHRHSQGRSPDRLAAKQKASLASRRFAAFSPCDDISPCVTCWTFLFDLIFILQCVDISWHIGYILLMCVSNAGTQPSKSFRLMCHVPPKHKQFQNENTHSFFQSKRHWI